MDEEENLDELGFHIEGDEDLDAPEDIPDFGLDEEDPDKDH